MDCGARVGTAGRTGRQPHRPRPSRRFARNESARHLRAGSSRTIGRVVLDIANPFFTDLARAVEDVASEQGPAVILCNSADDAGRETGYLDLLTEQRVQGVLITPTAELSPALAAVRRRGAPLVLVDRRAGGPDQCSVAVDEIPGGRLAADHVLERGHRRIAFVGGSSGLPQVQERYTGVLAAVRESCGSDEALTVLSPAQLTVAGGREAAERIIGLPAARRPTAVLCANALLALGVLQEMVRRAAELLLDEARGEGHHHEQLMYEPQLIVRESSMVRRTPEGTS